MSYARQRLGLPLIFLWAIAHGMWIGAAWHAGTQFGSANSLGQHVCNCSGFTTSHSPILSSATTAAESCPICQLGVIAPDVPTAVHAVSVAPIPYEIEHFSYHAAPRAVTSILPPSHAPPVV